LEIKESNTNEPMVNPTAEVMMPPIALPLPPNSPDLFNPWIDNTRPITPGAKPTTGIKPNWIETMPAINPFLA
jgi:hypothetical protein